MNWNNDQDRATMRARVLALLDDLDHGRWPATYNDRFYFQTQDPIRVRRLLLLELQALKQKDCD
tara:strand:- start:261 stop:452 length:192 start_codon:yes stop_codon:yes gene_type:complete